MPVPGQTGLTLVGAPPGYGKTWELRLCAEADGLRARPGGVVAAVAQLD